MPTVPASVRPTRNLNVIVGVRRPRAELERLIKLGVNGILSDLPAVMNSPLADMAKRRGS